MRVLGDLRGAWAAVGGVALVVGVVLLAGCEANTLEGNAPERAIDSYVNNTGAQVTDWECPDVGDNEQDLDGQTVTCTGVAALSDGSSRKIPIDVSFADCSVKQNDCDDVRVTLKPE